MARDELGATKRLRLRWALAVVSLAVVAAVAWLALRAPRGAGILQTLPMLLDELPKDEQRIGQIILDNFKEYRANARNWSAAYFGCLFFSAVSAALAGLVIKLEFFIRNDALKKDLAALLAMLSALLITLSTVGDFHQKWWSNRLAAAKIERVGYAFMTADRKANLEVFSSQIQAISYERNAEIVAGETAHNRTGEARTEERPKALP